MLISDSQKAREVFYNSLFSNSKSRPEQEQVIKKFEQDIIQNTKEEVGAKFKQLVIILIISLFVLSVFGMWAGLYLIYTDEISLIREKILDADKRVINSTIISALIGATVVQIATAFGIAVRYVFEKKNDSSEHAPLSNVRASSSESSATDSRQG